MEQTNKPKIDFKNYLKNWFNNLKSRKKILLIALAIIGALLMIDFLTKGLVFNGDKSGNTSLDVVDIKILGFRSQFHKSTTFLDFIGKSLPYWSSLLINYLLLILFIVFILIASEKTVILSLAISISGIIGNTIDASIFQGVRNALYLPWWDNGTFNFADIYIVLGAISCAISFIWGMFKKS